jgi:hypothetical protein
VERALNSLGKSRARKDFGLQEIRAVRAVVSLHSFPRLFGGLYENQKTVGYGVSGGVFG